MAPRPHHYLVVRLLVHQTGGVSNYSITNQADRKQKHIQHKQEDRAHGKKKVFFATPHFWSYVNDGQQQGAKQTQHIDIFTFLVTHPN
jgi:hypothetical protein